MLQKNMSNLLKKIFEKISYIKRYLLIQLNVNFGYPYHYFGKKITASKETYLEIYASSKNKTCGFLYIALAKMIL